MNVISEALREFEIFCQFVELSLPAKTFGIVTYKNENREKKVAHFLLPEFFQHLYLGGISVLFTTLF